MPSSPVSTPRLSWKWLYLLLTLFVVSVVAFKWLQPVTVLPRIAPAPGYQLTNQNGELINSEQKRGQITLYSFSDVGCIENCRQSIQTISALRNNLQAELPPASSLQFVTLSVNPALDAATNVAAVVGDAESDQDAIRWDLLTGRSDQMKQIIGGGFNLFYEAKIEAGQQLIDFVPRYVLVDGNGMIRAYYNTAEPDVEILLRDLIFILEEAQYRGSALGNVAYGAAHLFSCYPR